MNGDLQLDINSLATQTATVRGRIKFDTTNAPAPLKPQLRIAGQGTGAATDIAEDGSFQFPQGFVPGEYTIGLTNAPKFMIWGMAASGGRWLPAR